MEIGGRIKQLRVRLGLTQEELADRSELSKGFISQLERDMTSPSIATLVDILSALGTDLQQFFAERTPEQVVYTQDDCFVKEYPADLKLSIRWLVPGSQENSMEPILVTLDPGGHTDPHDPHEGEEFGHVISGSVILRLGERSLKVRKGESFSFHPGQTHELFNEGKVTARVLWVVTPPSF